MLEGGIGHQISRLLASREGADFVRVQDLQTAPGTPRILEIDAIADLQSRQPVGVDAGMHECARDRHGGTRRTQTHMGGSHEAAEVVTLGPKFQHRCALRQAPRAQLRSAEIHQDAHRTAHGTRRAAHPRRHRLPLVRPVVSTVDAGNVHAGGDQLAHQPEVTGRLGGQRDHDAHGPLGRRRAQQVGRVALQQLAAAAGTNGLVAAMCGPGLPGQPVQDAQHLVQIGHGMGFGAAQ
ncbi:MAG: hypothetical protein BWX79_03046 [Alphaproteobacteria bacterium ADurb.Bin100]|nr:MAG: hypothetical protein BWX79_03046 [Alphaproteobacteria bacterium ADurb.Bin100]